MATVISSPRTQISYPTSKYRFSKPSPSASSSYSLHTPRGLSTVAASPSASSAASLFNKMASPRLGHNPIFTGGLSSPSSARSSPRKLPTTQHTSSFSSPSSSTPVSVSTSVSRVLTPSNHYTSASSSSSSSSCSPGNAVPVAVAGTTGTSIVGGTQVVFSSSPSMKLKTASKLSSSSMNSQQPYRPINLSSTTAKTTPAATTAATTATTHNGGGYKSTSMMATELYMLQELQRRLEHSKTNQNNHQNQQNHHVDAHSQQSEIESQCSGSMAWMSEVPSVIVNDFLFLGTKHHARDINVIKSLNIRFIVNITTTVPNYFAEDSTFPVKYLNIKISDEKSRSISEHFESIVSFIDAARMQSGNVLVHCAKGISRSATSVIAYLMRSKRWPLQKAVTYTQRCRPVIMPNIGFFVQLLEYESKIFGRTSVTVDDYTDIFNWDTYMMNLTQLQLEQKQQQQRKPR